MSTCQLSQQGRVHHLKPGQLLLSDPAPGRRREEQAVDHLVAAQGDLIQDAQDGGNLAPSFVYPVLDRLLNTPVLRYHISKIPCGFRFLHAFFGNF